MPNNATETRENTEEEKMVVLKRKAKRIERYSFV
jgi:hypothetical protein